MNKVDKGPLYPLVVSVVEHYDGLLSVASDRTYVVEGGGVSACSFDRDAAISRALAKLEARAIRNYNPQAAMAAKAEQRRVNQP